MKAKGHCCETRKLDPWLSILVFQVEQGVDLLGKKGEESVNAWPVNGGTGRTAPTGYLWLGWVSLKFVFF